MRSRTAAAAGAALLMAALAAPASAQEPMVEVVAEGLNAPRGLALASDGSIYVAEAGAGGDQCMGEEGEQVCMGLSGAITRITDGVATPVLTGLHSMIIGGVEIVGPADVALIDDESFYAVINLGGDPAEREGAPEPNKSQAGWLIGGAADGTMEAVADVAAFESSDNPEPTLVDSNPQSVTISEAGVVVADAGGNSLLSVDESGAVSLIAAFPPMTVEFTAEEVAAMGPPPGEEGELPATEGEAPAEGEGEAPAAGEMVPIPVEAVPTSVVVGPDDALYMGQLTGGPFPVGAASVWRVVPGEEPTQYATGFTNIIDIGFGPDGTLYVAEIVHAGLMSVFAGGQPPIGALLSVPPGGGEAQVVVTGEQLMAPGGLAVAEDGSVYVSTGTLSPPGGGAVVKVTP